MAHECEPKLSTLRDIQRSLLGIKDTENPMISKKIMAVSKQIERHELAIKEAAEAEAKAEEARAKAAAMQVETIEKEEPAKKPGRHQDRKQRK